MYLTSQECLSREGVMGRKDIVTAVLKEKNYEEARRVIEAYWKAYAWRKRVDEKTRSVELDVKPFPQSAARMMTFALLSRLSEANQLSVNVHVGSNGKAVERLLSEDLFPRIHYRRVQSVLRISQESLLPWLQRKRVYHIDVECTV